MAETSAIALMGELLLLPSGLSHSEWVKFAGLDPRAFESGKSVHPRARLAKADNSPIRSALTRPAALLFLLHRWDVGTTAVCNFRCHADRFP
jgi:transposase